jgi:hypothetical protein
MSDNILPSSSSGQPVVVGGGHHQPGWVGRWRSKLLSPSGPWRRLLLFGLPLLLVSTALLAFLFWPKAKPATETARKTPGAVQTPSGNSVTPDEPAPTASDKKKSTSSSKKSSAGSSGSSSSGSSGGSSGGSGGRSGGGSSSGSSACPLPAYPTASCTGVPSGWSPSTTINGDLTVTTDGAVIENYLVKGMIDVRANNVTIRKTRTYGGIDNFVTNIVYGPLLIEDSEVVLPPGQTESWDYGHVIGTSDFTCRRCKITGRAEGWRVGATGYSGAGPVTIEHSYAKLQVTQAQCDADDPHGDGIQGYGGTFVTIRHNTIDQRDDPCPTAPIFIPDQGNDGATVVDNVVAGGGFSLRLTGGSLPTVTGNKVVANSWGYGPLDVDCGLIGTWSGNATVNFNWTTGTIINQVQALNDC